MRERPAQTVLIIRAFEETDRDGAVLPMAARAAATRRALRVTGLADWSGDLYETRNIKNGETVHRRARLLFDSLAHHIPGLRGLLHVARLGASTAPLIVGTAFLLGLATNALGPQGRINLLSVPLLGVLAWNLGSYCVRLLVSLAGLRPPSRGRESATPGRRRVVDHLADVFLKGAIWRRLFGWRLGDDRADPARRRVTTRSIVRFGALWQRCAGPLLAARVRRTLHLGALALALGTLAGVYVRGVALEYRATWESTWLDSNAVQRLMDGVLGPAAGVLGSDVPDVAPLKAPGDGNAAAWIHLYAVTILLVVGLPRTALALYESLRCARLAAEVPVELEAGYFRRLLREWRGATTSVEIVPYSYAPTPQAVQRLKSVLRDFYGARADIVTHAPLSYGDRADDLCRGGRGPGPWKPPRDVGEDLTDSQVLNGYVLLFNLAQSPEVEVHGEFLEELKDRVAAIGGRLVVVLDLEAYSGRVRARTRRRERLRAWQRIAKHAGLQTVILDPAAEDEPRLSELAGAVWPAEKTPVGSLDVEPRTAGPVDR